MIREARLYAVSLRRLLLQPRRVGREERLVFVVGSPRSGTTFLGETIGRLPGFVDLGEVGPFKSAIPRLQGLTAEEAARSIRTIVDRVRRLGLVTGLRAVEHTPELAFVLPAALHAYPRARAVHAVRDGRDVVCSLLERGWLRADRPAEDWLGLPYGSRARFWVERERADEFEHASDAKRAAWAWRVYVSTARASSERTLELRYESLVRERGDVAQRLAEHLGVSAKDVDAGLAYAHDGSVGRYRRDLTPEQLADIDREAGPLLRELGYV